VSALLRQCLPVSPRYLPCFPLMFASCATIFAKYAAFRWQKSRQNRADTQVCPYRHGNFFYITPQWIPPNTHQNTLPRRLGKKTPQVRQGMFRLICLNNVIKTYIYSLKVRTLQRCKQASNLAEIGTLYPYATTNPACGNALHPYATLPQPCKPQFHPSNKENHR